MLIWEADLIIFDWIVLQAEHYLCDNFKSIRFCLQTANMYKQEGLKIHSLQADDTQYNIV